MTDIELKPNQAALIIEVSGEGEIVVDIAFPEESTLENELASAMCEVIANKLIYDENFQSDILLELQEEENGSGNA